MAKTVMAADTAESSVLGETEYTQVLRILFEGGYPLLSDELRSLQDIIPSCEIQMPSAEALDNLTIRTDGITISSIACLQLIPNLEVFRQPVQMRLWSAQRKIAIGEVLFSAGALNAARHSISRQEGNITANVKCAVTIFRRYIDARLRLLNRAMQAA